MATLETSDAEPIYDGSNKLIGFVRLHTADLWLPLDTAGENLTDPTYKMDAQTIVKLAAEDKL